LSSTTGWLPSQIMKRVSQGFTRRSAVAFYLPWTRYLPPTKIWIPIYCVPICWWCNGK
jgi:hypothetical protein